MPEDVTLVTGRGKAPCQISVVRVEDLTARTMVATVSSSGAVLGQAVTLKMALTQEASAEIVVRCSNSPTGKYVISAIGSAKAPFQRLRPMHHQVEPWIDP